MDKTKILELIRDNPYKIGHWVGFDKLTELHNEWLKSFLFSSKDQTLLAHRNSYKTTVLALFLAIHSIIKPNENVLFFRKTDTDIREVIRQVGNILKSDVMQILTNELFSVPVKLIKDTDSEIQTNLCTTAKGASQLVGLGIGTSITGKHADIVVTDDIVNIKDRISHAEREHTKSIYMELQNIKTSGGRIINTGTPWHKEDAISIMPNITRYDCYSTDLMSKEEIKAKREVMTDSLFSANYELKIIADSETMFANPQFTDSIESIYGGIAHIDASYGGSDGTAYTVVKRTDDGFVAYGKVWKKHIDDCLIEIKTIHNNLRAGSISCETNADKGYLRKELENQGFKVNNYHEKMNKYIKISTYLKKDWEKIKWLDITDSEYINEILDFNEFAQHDDCPDSIASLLRKFENKITYNNIQGGF